MFIFQKNAYFCVYFYGESFDFCVRSTDFYKPFCAIESFDLPFLEKSVRFPLSSRLKTPRAVFSIFFGKIGKRRIYF